MRFSPGGDYNPETLKIKIDKKEAVLWPHKKPVKIDDLELTGRHLVVLTSDGKPIQSFWFRFSDYKSRELCISFDGYEGVDLRERKDAPLCKCE